MTNHFFAIYNYQIKVGVSKYFRLMEGENFIGDLSDDDDDEIFDDNTYDDIDEDVLFSPR